MLNTEDPISSQDSPSAARDIYFSCKKRKKGTKHV